MSDLMLITDRCRMRRLSRADAPHVVSASQVPGFTDGMAWGPMATEEETHEFTDKAMAEWDAGTRYVWTIEDKNDASFIGRIELKKKDNDGWELGYWIHPREQGKGFATEAAMEVLRCGFEELGIEMISAFHADWNEASGRVMQKIGMKHVGFADDRLKKEGKPVRSSQYAITRDEWVKQ